MTVLTKKWTRCKINQDMYDEFVAGDYDTLVIIVEGGTGEFTHPEGEYSIPRDKALEFFKEKSILPTWSNTQQWVSFIVPTSLIEYWHERR